LTGNIGLGLYDPVPIVLDAFELEKVVRRGGGVESERGETTRIHLIQSAPFHPNNIHASIWPAASRSASGGLSRVR